MAVALFLAACTATSSPSPSPVSEESLFGGTLRVGSPSFVAIGEQFDGDYFLDPQAAALFISGMVMHCCLTRTLMTYPGTSMEEGGGVITPDLAAAPPTVSADGLTWTFELRHGLRYAPPFADVEITTPDLKRGLERTLRIGSYYARFFEVIEGATAYRNGSTSSISGVETPDDYTIVFRLTAPTGDFDARTSLPMLSPIPPGADDGHDDGIGRFLVSSGPYMIAGSEELDFSRPPERQAPVSGYVPGESITLVRNPSWDPDTDPVRIGYAERIEIIDVGPQDLNVPVEDRAVSRAFEAGEIDLVDWADHRWQDHYRNDPQRRWQVFEGDLVTANFVNMNLGVPPFDDVHVRRAVNLVIDRQALLEIREAGFRHSPHFTPEIFTGGLLTEFDPYFTPGRRGDAEAAADEMAESAYDSDGDGVCDDPACRGVPAAALSFFVTEQHNATAAAIEADLEKLGIELELELTATGDRWNELSCPATAPAMRIPLYWTSDYPDISSWIRDQTSSARIGCGDGNLTLLGASPAQLAEWGYSVTEVPSVDDRIERCSALLGSEATRCWANLEQFLLTAIVPWIPLFHEVFFFPVSDRVTRFSYDEAFGFPALDKIAVSGDTSPD